jgi:hypothetical protein
MITYNILVLNFNSRVIFTLDIFKSKLKNIFTEIFKGIHFIDFNKFFVLSNHYYLKSIYILQILIKNELSHFLVSNLFFSNLIIRLWFLSNP